MKIYVLRHGVTELNKKGVINGHTNDPLAPEGIEQAKMAASILPSTIKRIYASSLERAKQTAEIVNETLQVPISFHDELMEVNFGVLNGTPFLEEIKMRHRMVDYDWRPSGELVDDVKARVLKMLRVIKEENGDAEALIVAHGGIIRMMHFLAYGKILEEIQNTALHDFDLTEILS